MEGEVRGSTCFLLVHAVPFASKESKVSDSWRLHWLAESHFHIEHIFHSMMDKLNRRRPCSTAGRAANLRRHTSFLGAEFPGTTFHKKLLPQTSAKHHVNLALTIVYQHMHFLRY